MSGAAHSVSRAALPSAGAVLEQAAAENFPVALRLLPAARRRDLMAIYGYARLVDDVGDEISGDRLAALDALEADVDRLYAGSSPQHPLVRALGDTVRRHGIPREPLARLIEANRQDQRVAEYATYEALCEYCALSANPVGHLVLYVFGAATPEHRVWSDSICTGLQIIEHCQDVGEDYQTGRVYLPAEDLKRFGCERAALGARSASPPLRRTVALQVERVRQLLRAGEPLVGALGGFARLAVAGFAAGGYAAADAVEAQDFDVLRGLARPSRARTLRHALRLFWSPYRG